MTGFDRLATTTYPLGTTEVLTYDADSNVSTRKTRANQTIGFAYDTLNRLKTKTPPAPAAVVSYTYDLAGRPISVSDTSAAIAAAVSPSGPSVQYATSAAYDALNRPTGISWTPAPTAAAPSASSVSFGHAYNKANQRIAQTASDNGWFNYPAVASPVSYTSDALNRYTAVGAVVPTYDGNSNLTFDGTFTFGYDAENRLTTAVGAGNTAAYTYDAQGRRKTKTVNGTTTVFVTDAGNREVLEYDGASGAILRWYAYGLGSNDVLNQTNVVAGTRAALIPGIQGSVIASLDSSSSALSKIGYLPYGKSTSTSAPFGFTGQRIDPETNGLYYYRARHYSPAWGRFMQPDPIGYGGGVNLYAYVSNDPLNLIDPIGFTANNPLRNFATNAYNAVLAQPVNDTTQFASDLQRDPLDTLSRLLNSFPQTRVEGEFVAGVVAGVSVLQNFARGAASEARVLQDLGLTRNTQSVLTAEGRSVPDALTDSISVEIKDSAYVYRSRQVRIQTEAARESGRQSVLVTGTKYRNFRSGKPSL